MLCDRGCVSDVHWAANPSLLSRNGIDNPPHHLRLWKQNGNNSSELLMTICSVPSPFLKYTAWIISFYRQGTKDKEMKSLAHIPDPGTEQIVKWMNEEWSSLHSQYTPEAIFTASNPFPGLWVVWYCHNFLPVPLPLTITIIVIKWWTSGDVSGTHGSAKCAVLEISSFFCGTFPGCAWIQSGKLRSTTH